MLLEITDKLREFQGNFQYTGKALHQDADWNIDAE